nr:hypothetical protein [Tanacetum cinerariifolium]
MLGFAEPCPHAILPPYIKARASLASPISKQQKQYIATVDGVLEFASSVKVLTVPHGTNLYLYNLAPSVGPNIFSTKEVDGRHVSALKFLVKSHNRKNKGDPIRLDFETVEAEIQGHTVVKGKETLDESTRGWFERLPHDNINEWEELREAFATVETGFIMEVLEVMKILSFIDSVKSPELAKRFSDKVLAMVNEMMERLDDFIRSKKACASTELPKGETGESHRKMSLPFNERDTRPFQNAHWGESRRDEFKNTYRGRDTYRTNRARHDRAPYLPSRGEYNRRVTPEPLIVEAKVEGYLVRRVYVDEGSSVEVMFEHCFENLNPRIKDRLRETQTDLVGFAGVVSKPVGKIELEKKQMIEGGRPEEKGEVAATEEVLINLSFPNQLVTIGEGLSKASKDQLKCLLKDNIGVFAWEPSDMAEKSWVVANQVFELAKAGMVRPVKYPTYISNPVLVKKGDGTWRMCIDFKNLNLACPKDYYPLSNIDCKVESVMGFKYKCFLDAYKEYHHIQMAKEDEEKIASYTDRGTYCYTKMLFGLKNAGAMYQRLVDSAFQSQIGRKFEAYVDDMVIKSRDEKMLLADIEETLDNLKKINMKLNPKKCSFEVEEGKFLGYVVTSEGIRANPKNTKDLADLQPSQMLKEMQSLNGKLASLSHFLAKSSERSLPFLNTLKNITKENKHETLNEAERNYAPIEKLALSLIHMTQRSRRYFEAHMITVTTDQPIKNILINTETSRKLAKYVVDLGAYNIMFIPRNVVKGASSGRFPFGGIEGPKEDLYFWMLEATVEKDEVKRPNGIEYTYALRLTFFSTNNEAEYEALLAELRISWQMNISKIDVKVDSKLVASQINRTYKANKDSMIKYLAKAREYVSRFKSFLIENIPKNMNQKADVLSKLASMAFNHLTKEVLVEILNERSIENQEVHTIVEEEGNNWMTLIIQILEEGTVLFKKGYLVPMLRCVGPLQANYVIREIHMGSYDMHVGPRAVVRKVIRQGYYWSTMHEDAKKEVENVTHAKYMLRFGLPRVIVIDNGAQLAHRTSIKQSNKEIPFSLTYGSEAVIPAEIGIPTYRTLMIREGYNEEQMRLNLDLLQEKREVTAIREAKYKTKMEQYYNRKVRLAGFRPRDFVFRRNKASKVEDQGKLGPKWEGPYRVVKAYENGSYKLQTLEDKEIPRTWHVLNLRECYM